MIYGNLATPAASSHWPPDGAEVTSSSQTPRPPWPFIVAMRIGRAWRTLLARRVASADQNRTVTCSIQVGFFYQLFSTTSEKKKNWTRNKFYHADSRSTISEREETPGQKKKCLV